METFYVLLHVLVSTVNPSEPPWANASPKTIYKNIESCEEFLDSLYQTRSKFIKQTIESGYYKKKNVQPAEVKFELNSVNKRVLTYQDFSSEKKHYYFCKNAKMNTRKSVKDIFEGS